MGENIVSVGVSTVPIGVSIILAGVTGVIMFSVGVREVWMGRKVPLACRHSVLHLQAARLAFLLARFFFLTFLFLLRVILPALITKLGPDIT